MAITRHPESRFLFAHTGFTLAELMMALAIGIILTTMAVPAFSSILEESRLMSHIYKFISHLSYARESAITSGTQVTLCKSMDGTSCDKTLEWENGWITFLDTSRDRKRTDDERILRVQQSINDKITISYSASLGRNNYVSFRPMGNSVGNGTFTFCTEHTAIQPRAVILARTGKVRIAREKPNGKPLRCP